MHTPSAEQINDDIEYLRDNAAGYSSIEHYAAENYPYHTEAFRAALVAGIKAAI
ncbi:hypothetical protein SEA_NICOLE72_76 [Microbacterium phage Nicole72]|uniref:Uncharacterized protein n=1 Tax=Microbacterium phage Nicole72 TaxID=3062838 RepID=A0ACD4UHU1_9CAUD|nr:hypothetical protein SEA_NICOLE72_76 [Microbacterium phage Nicole72]